MKSRHLEWNRPLVSLSLHLRGPAVTKGRNINSFVRVNSLCCTLAVRPDDSDIDLQAEVSRFRCRIFLLFCLFCQNLVRLSSVFIFYKLFSGD